MQNIICSLKLIYDDVIRYWFLQTNISGEKGISRLICHNYHKKLFIPYGRSNQTPVGKIQLEAVFGEFRMVFSVLLKRRLITFWGQQNANYAICRTIAMTKCQQLYKLHQLFKLVRFVS